MGNITMRTQLHMFAKSALASGVALAALAMPGAAFAQADVTQVPPQQANVESTGNDIVVTARKRSEDIQTVPIAITALTAADLASRNISNFNDLANATPGVAITSIAGGNVQNIYIRGLAPGNTANDLNVEANVGVFIDGIYQTSRNTLDMISVLDVGQIEIAKGPQSALFGRSTFAGALTIQTKRPSHNWDAAFSATVGQDEDYRARGTISGPLGGGLYFRVGGGFLTYDGYGYNSAEPKNKLGGTEKYAGSAALEYAPNSNFSALLSGFITHSQSEVTPLTLLPFSSFNCGNKNAATGISLLYCGDLPVNTVSDITPGIPKTTAKTRQIALNLDWKLGGVEVVSVTGYTAAENRAYNDYDGTSAGLAFGVCQIGNPANAQCGSTNFGLAPYTRIVRANLHSTGVERVRTFSQELRFQSDKRSPFQWQLGGSYFLSRIPLAAGGIGTDMAGLSPTERFVQLPITGVVPATGTGAYDFTANPFIVSNANANQLFGSYSVARTRTLGVFGSIGYQLGNLRVNAEGRYNVDRKRAQVFSITNATSAPFINQPINGTDVPVTGVFPVVGTPYARTFKSFTPRFTVDYRATPEIFLYASAAKGVRSGGFNTANPSGTCATCILPSEVAYDEESNWTYEAGFKSNLFNRSLLFNASVFHVDWKNAQVATFTSNPASTGNTVRPILNTGNIKATGFEVQADYKFMQMFGIGGSFIYSNPKFQRGAIDGSQIAQCVVGTGLTATAAPGCQVITITRANGTQQVVPSLEGKRPQRSVKTQWNVHATVNAPLGGDLRLSGRVDVNYTGKAYNNVINTTSFGKRTLTNARLGIETSHYGLSVWGNNIFNEHYVVNSINQPRAAVPFGGLSVPEIYLGESRRIGVTGSFKF